MSGRPSTLAVVPSAAVPCLRYPGFGAGEWEHPEGVCGCFRGGPSPRRAAAPDAQALITWLTAEEAVLIWGPPAERAVA